MQRIRQNLLAIRDSGLPVRILLQLIVTERFGLLLADLDEVTAGTGTVAPPKGLRVRRLDYGYHRERELDRSAEAGGPYSRGLADVREDHGYVLGWALNVQLLEADTRLVGADWAEAVGSTEFVAVRGMTGPHTEFLPNWVRWARNSHTLHLGNGPPREAPARRYLMAEAPDGPIRDALLVVGFRAVSTARSYVWAPVGPPPAATRPVSMLIGDRDHATLCAELQACFTFKPSYTYYPAIKEPPDSVTWHVGDVTDACHAPHPARRAALAAFPGMLPPYCAPARRDRPGVSRSCPIRAW
ncbi:hypothetical protein [Streptomyces europaeiscabiei]|uniref:hypothetical protein n=1 Tax=Streptomyces europaeiscabiei TaxID=146819 RepID=UPI002E118ED0|nr:hypothetical protein OHB30_02785 [Streptomyces europaeiscabiei]